MQCLVARPMWVYIFGLPWQWGGPSDSLENASGLRPFLLNILWWGLVYLSLISLVSFFALFLFSLNLSTSMLVLKFVLLLWLMFMLLFLCHCHVNVWIVVLICVNCYLLTCFVYLNSQEIVRRKVNINSNVVLFFALVWVSQCSYLYVLACMW